VLLQVLCGRPRGLAELEAVSRQVSRDMWHIVNLRIASARKRTRSSNRSNRTKRLRLAAQPDLRKCGYRHQQTLQPVSSIAKAISASNERRIMVEKATRAKEPNTVTEPRRDSDFKKRPVVDVRSGRPPAEGLRSALHNAFFGFAQLCGRARTRS
jgi:hypothetical protein